MRTGPSTAARILPDGTPLHNRLLRALSAADYARLAPQLRMAVPGQDLLHDPGRPISDVYFPNSGVYSITTPMRDGALVEVAMVGREGMLGLGVFLGDRAGTGRTLQQVGDGALPALRTSRFLRELTRSSTLREVLGLYAQASLLQAMQWTACNALHDVRQRCCRWLLQTHDRLDADDLPLKQEFLAVMLGVRRPTVTVVLRALQESGLIARRYGRIRIVRRARLEAASCECYGVIQAHFTRLGLRPR